MKAALFDLDGVIVDTENQYTAFWSEMQRLYLPDNVDFALQIKGQSLTCILKEYFLGENVRREVLRRLEAFEATMSYPYINGARAFVESLKAAGVPTAIVTSSNKAKMDQLYKAIPDFRQLFIHILTAEDFRQSKPSPDCYITAARRLGICPEDCVVFEDSFNGIEAGRLSGAFVVGLATTNPADVLTPLCDIVISDFCADNLNKINKLFYLFKQKE